MRAYLLSLTTLLGVAFALATRLEPWFQGWAGSRTRSANLLSVALGDGRRMFANHFFVKADAYFHSGHYPTIFDNREAFQTPHIGEDAGAMEGRNEGNEHGFLGPPLDWLDRFSREFYPSKHTHLGERDHDHDHDHDGHEHDHDHASHDDHRCTEREILPWLRLSAELDPERAEAYTVAAYWLRRIGKVKEAERFLRDGLNANPGQPQLLFEMGQIHVESHQDEARARNLWELALRNWHRQEDGKAEPNDFLRAQILVNLATLEERQTNYVRAIERLNALKAISPNSESVQKWIDEVKAKKY